MESSTSGSFNLSSKKAKKREEVALLPSPYQLEL
jgi:hypothetical protein